MRGLRNSGEGRILGKFIDNKGCPLRSKRGQIPVLVELFNVISNILIEIFKDRAGFLTDLCSALQIIEVRTKASDSSALSRWKHVFAMDAIILSVGNWKRFSSLIFSIASALM